MSSAGHSPVTGRPPITSSNVRCSSVAKKSPRMSDSGRPLLSGCSSSETSPSFSHRSRTKAGSMAPPVVIAAASSAPLMPPALEPVITSITSSRRNARHSAPYVDLSSPSARVRRARSSSTAQPPIQTARLTPPLSASATRTSSTFGSTGIPGRPSHTTPRRASGTVPTVIPGNGKGPHVLAFPPSRGDRFNGPAEQALDDASLLRFARPTGKPTVFAIVATELDIVAP